jgi:truncated hemoglobin YjbI
MTERTLYDRIGGQETVSNIMDNLFDTRLPADTTTEPPVWELFTHVKNSDATLAMHKELVGSFIGSLLGDTAPKHAISAEELLSWHSDTQVTAEHFDVVAGHLLEAVRDESGNHAEDAAEAIGAVALELRSAVVQVP